MAKGSPSMIALLGLLAVAGYQNRDKLSGLLQDGAQRRDHDDPLVDRNDGVLTAGPSHDGTTGSGNIIDDFRRMIGGGTGGRGGLAGGLAEILGRFTNPVQSAKARTWVDTGPNSALDAGDLEQALDEETLAELSQKTGLSREELLSRLSTVLPDAVDQFTPDGRMPSDDEVSRGTV